MRYAKGVRSGWGKCFEELKARIPERFYDALAAEAALRGVDKAELLREQILAQRYAGELERITGARHEVPSGENDAQLTTELPSRARDALSALALVSGSTPEAYLRDLVMAHLYGHGPITTHQADRVSGGDGS